MMKYMSWLLMTFAIAGCTVIKTEQSNVEVQYYFGIPFISFSSEESTQYNSVTSFGLGLSNRGIYLGYISNKQFIKTEPSNCSAIIFVADHDEMEDVIASLEKAELSLDELCIYKE